MKILFVTSELHPWKTGGPQNVVYNLANRMAREIDLSILCVSPGGGASPYERYHEGISFRLVEDRGPTWSRYLARNLDYLHAAGRVEQYDVVHFHILPGANCFFLPPYMRRNSRARLVLTFYDWVPDELGFYGFGERIVHVFHWAAARRRLACFDHFVVNSTYIREIVRSRGLGPIEIIPNGIDLEDWRMLDRIPLRGEVNILFWGRLYEKKGVGQLIRAMVDNLGYREDLHLYIGGEGSGLRRYQELCRTLGVEDKVTFLGALPGRELKSYLSACDFCVFPSVYEGFGISILEAMAAGKPVITSRRGGQADFARDRNNALLVDPGQTRELAGAMRELIEDSALRDRLGASAAMTATAYTWDRVTRRCLEFYENVAKGGRSR